jgi:hypothetical protein
LKKIFLLALSCFFVSGVLFAQGPQQKITYHGQFRTLLGDYNLSGNILDGDTTSERRGAEGTMFFDFGIHCKPDENFKFLAEFRFRNQIGNLDPANTTSPAGAGVIQNNIINSRMLFRQVRVEGNLKKVVQYQMGDIDLGLTKYTVYNNDEIFKTYESDIYRTRREVSQYETFQNGNLWRLQGITAKTQINFNKAIQRVNLTMFGTRTKKNDFELAVLDRYLVGGKLDVTQSKFLSLGVNWSGFFDVLGTSGYTVSTTVISPTSQIVINEFLSDTAYNYNNQVLSLSYKITPFDNDKYELNVMGESGFSKNRYFLASEDSTSKKDDYFIDAGLRLLYKPKKVELTASYINVGADFTSPGAQTLRLNPLGRTNILGSVDNRTAYRVPTIFERYASSFIYNQRIQTGLMMFLPLYGNVLPYGAATPNRSGIVFDLGKLNEPGQVLSASVGGAMLSEIVSEGDSTGNELRKFMQLKGGVALKVSNLIGYKRNITATVGGRYENTSRGGSNVVDYKSVLFDGGLTFEITKDLSLLGGVKYLHGNGTEVLTVRDVFGGISGFSPYISDITQTVVSGGIRIDLFNNSFASVEYNNIVAKNNLDVGENYSLGNLFFNFTLRF